MEFNNAGYDIFSEAGVNPALCLSNRDTSEGMRRGTTRRQATGAYQHQQYCQTEHIGPRRQGGYDVRSSDSTILKHFGKASL